MRPFNTLTDQSANSTRSGLCYAIPSTLKPWQYLCTARAVHSLGLMSCQEVAGFVLSGCRNKATSHSKIPREVKGTHGVLQGGAAWCDSPFLGHSTIPNSRNTRSASFLNRTFPVSQESVLNLWKQLLGQKD